MEAQVGLVAMLSGRVRLAEILYLNSIPSNLLLHNVRIRQEQVSCVNYLSALSIPKAELPLTLKQSALSHTGGWEHPIILIRCMGLTDVILHENTTLERDCGYI